MKTQELQKNNIGVKILMKCVHCLLWCLEKCARYITMQAYIMIAIEGNGFCLSAWRSFKLLFSNTLRIATTQVPPSPHTRARSTPPLLRTQALSSCERGALCRAGAGLRNLDPLQGLHHRRLHRRVDPHHEGGGIFHGGAPRTQDAAPQHAQVCCVLRSRALRAHGACLPQGEGYVENPLYPAAIIFIAAYFVSTVRPDQNLNTRWTPQ
jgi:hypothetical protein